MAKMTEVIALEAGHDGRVFRQAGERFHVDMEDKRFEGATWFVEPEKAPPPKAKPTSTIPPGAGPKKGSGMRDHDPESES